MPLPSGFTDELLYRCNIVDVVSPYVRLKKTGANYVGLCPFHTEKTPSFTVSAEKQLFKCFGCGEGGNVITFIMKIENISFMDAVKKLADMYGMTVPENDDPQFTLRKRILELNRAAAKYYYEILISEAGRHALEYLLRRGMTKAAITSFGLGYADQSWDGLIHAMQKLGFTRTELEAARLATKGQKGGFYNFFRDRIMFPIIDVRGDVIAFSGRVLTSGAEGRKYVNSPDTPVYNKSRALYGINLAKRTKEDHLLLVEGNMDVIALHQAGFSNAIATCGTALTSSQAQLMSKYTHKVTICFDQDDAGKKATDKAIDILSGAQLEVRVLRLPAVRNERGELVLTPDGKPVKDDPDSFIRKNGGDAFRLLLEKPPSDIQYRLSTIKSGFDLSSDNGRIAYLKEAAKYLATVPSDIEREVFTRNTARAAALSEDALLSEVARIRAARVRERNKKVQQQAKNPVSAAQPQERGIRYENPASAVSEERLLTICLSDTALLSEARARLSPSQFSSPLLGKIYEAALSHLDEHSAISPAALVVGLPENETRHITSVLGGALPSADPKAELADCIEKINYEFIKRTGGGGDLLNMMLDRKRNRG